MALQSPDSDHGRPPACKPMNSFHYRKRIALFSWLLIGVGGSFPASADALKCREPNGKIVISNVPCAEQATVVSVQRSDTISAEQHRNALNDLQRQRQYLIERERDQAGSWSAAAAGKTNEPDLRDRIHACLMKITATGGLIPYETGRRKVDCYRGTRQLADECESRITATGGLTSPQEQTLKAQCRAASSG